MTWFNPLPLSYGIYKSAGSWTDNYQQLTLAWQTGIVIDGGSIYGLSGTVLQPYGGNVGIGVTAPTAKLEVVCPAGFTNIKAGNNQLGCMETAEHGTAAYFAAQDACFTSYGGRLPTVGEWHIAMSNYALTDETDDYEMLGDISYYTSAYPACFEMCGNGSIDTCTNGQITGVQSYRCWIPR